MKYRIAQQLKNILTIASLLFLTHDFCQAQDKQLLARTEYEMAEEALNTKQYSKVTEHLVKAKELLGQTNPKIDFLEIQNYNAFLKESSITKQDLETYHFALFRKTSDYLKKYASNSDEKYAEVYRLQTDIRPRFEQLKADFNNGYTQLRNYQRAIDSLQYLGKANNWLEQRRGLDTIWTLGRTFDAIIAHYKKNIAKDLIKIKNILPKEIAAQPYEGVYYSIPLAFGLERIYEYLPKDQQEVSFNGVSYKIDKAYFRADGRLFGLRYLQTNNVPVKFSKIEDVYYASANHFSTASRLIFQYTFPRNEPPSIWMMQPYASLTSSDADGRKVQSQTLQQRFPSIVASSSQNMDYLYGYRPSLGLKIRNAEEGGVLITDAVAGNSGAKAGLKTGDVITRINHTRVGETNGLIDAIYIRDPGEIVEVEYLRNGSRNTIKAVVGKLNLTY